MRLLLDTHTFLWWADNPEKLSAYVRVLCEDPATFLIVRVVSLWEIQIKVQRGKLALAVPLKTMIESQRQTNHLQILPVTFDHVLELDNLPTHHKDPFDCLLIAQSNVEQMPLASADTVLSQYPVSLLW